MDGDTKDLDVETRAKIEDIKNMWSAQGKRVILLARKVISKEHIRADTSSSQFEHELLYLARSDLTLVGFVGIVDPPREEIPYVVSTLRTAGIRIFMVGSQGIYGRPMLTYLGYRGFQSHRASDRRRVRHNHEPPRHDQGYFSIISSGICLDVRN